MTNIVRQYLLSSFDERWMNFSMRLAAAKNLTSMENVHHFRVATRRLLVLLDLLNNLLPQSKYEKLRKYLRGLRSNFNALHDTQMIINSLIIAREKGLETQPFLKLMQKLENRFHKEAIRVISGLKPGHLYSNSIQIRIELVQILADPAFLELQILPKLDASYAEIKEISELVNPSEVTTIHNLRISYRKFRYMIEIIIPILHDYPSEYLAKIRTYQDLMGEIQNGEIILNQLNQLSKKVSESKRAPVLAYFQTSYDASIQTFLTEFVDVPNFWRDSSLSNMPWSLHPSSETNDETTQQANPDILLSETETTSINPEASLADTDEESKDQTTLAQDAEPTTLPN
jgi:CHAD domain-containing protein